MSSNFEKHYDFIENTISNYSVGECDDMFSAIVSYAEYAERRKDEGKDVEAGLLMAAALTTAHLFSLIPAGQYYRSEMKEENMDIKAMIVHIALKLAEVRFKDGSYEECSKYHKALDYVVSNYIMLKDKANEEAVPEETAVPV